MRRNNLVCLIILLIICTISARGQQQATYAQYMFNGLAINPAYAGTHEALSASFLTRFQNVGLDGAPDTQTFSAHSPLLNQRMSVGFMVVHDKIGVIGQTGINAIYAYRIPVSLGGHLSFGLQAGVGMYNARYSQLDLMDQGDLLLAQDLRQTRPNFGAGLYYHNEKWYAGVSMPHMMNNVFTRGSDLSTIRQSTPLIFSGGYVFYINHMFKLKPNFLFKVVDDRPVELDLNASLLFDEVIWFGVSYKFTNALTMLTEIQLTDQLRFGYAYSITTGPIRSAEMGSHEVLINYRFKFNMKGVVTPRYF
ncbi:MAG: type IX secretion system membrane protein PorP/SprF [Cyclobacteriaceae bacterium]